ncbi:2Fe-2S iron-sulfur cluster-binding protein [Pendulispora albinea]|uniref:(2Fe-2S)-binding protein n=1 Tax=Pendulispora albinea TaxID=2741071 RepID=A0ABZ2M653_9BACT
MPTVIFESPDNSSAPVRTEAPNGGALADLCDLIDAPVPFSCRSANCGTCRIHVLEGHELLLDAEDEELDVLDVFAVAPPAQRLACQAQMRSGAGLLRVRAVADNE